MAVHGDGWPERSADLRKNFAPARAGEGWFAAVLSAPCGPNVPGAAGWMERPPRSLPRGGAATGGPFLLIKLVGCAPGLEKGGQAVLDPACGKKRGRGTEKSRRGVGRSVVPKGDRNAEV